MAIKQTPQQAEATRNALGWVMGLIKRDQLATEFLYPDGQSSAETARFIHGLGGLIIVMAMRLDENPLAYLKAMALELETEAA